MHDYKTPIWNAALENEMIRDCPDEEERTKFKVPTWQFSLLRFWFVQALIFTGEISMYTNSLFSNQLPKNKISSEPK